jgi:serine/threonine protein phosphatase PrpC
MDTAQIGNDVNVGQGSHEGMSGKHNEDSLGVFAWNVDGKKKLILGVVADGVGGQIAGEVASRLAVDTVKRYFESIERFGDVNKHLDEAITAANQAVYEASQQNPQYRGMSTTMAVTALVEGLLYMAHVGDSRIYLFRDGELRQISTDHTWAQEAIEAGLLTPEQAKTHPNRNVIRRHLGGSPQVDVDHRLVLEPGQVSAGTVANQGMPLISGDTLLICSDGLTDMITDESVYNSMYAHYLDLSTASDELIEKANQAGGKDNITVVLLQVPPTEPLPPIVPAAAAVTQKSAAVTTTAASAAAVTAAMAKPATAVPAADAAPASEGRGIIFFLAGGVFAVILLAVIAGIAFVFISGRNDDEPTPTVESIPVVDPEGTAAATQGAPATAAIFTAEAATDVAETTEPDVTPENTPELIPTLRPTNTATATRIPPTLTFTPTATATDVPSGGSGGPGGPRPTDPPPPPPPPGG